MQLTEETEELCPRCGASWRCDCGPTWEDKARASAEAANADGPRPPTKA